MYRQKTKKELIVCVFVLFALFCCLLFHAQYSFCQSDESFYISNVKRLYQGDRLIIDEWHPTQFYLPILLPFYAAFRFFAGSDDGILYFFRIIAISISFISSMAFFIEIKKENSNFVAFCVAALLLLFSRANIPGVSYYNLNLHLSLFFFITLRNALKNHGTKAIALNILSGISLSLAVLCQPYTAFLYLLLMVYLIINKSTRKNGWFVFITVLLMGTTYLLFCFFRDSVASYLLNIQYVLSDPAHNKNIFSSLKDILYVYYKYISIPYCLSTIVLCAWFYYSRRKGKPLSRFQIACQIVLLYIMLAKPLIHINAYPCYSLFAFITVAVLPSVIYYIRQKEKCLMIELYLLGICLSILWGIGSNTGLDGMIVGYCISGIGALLLIARIIHDMYQISWRRALLSFFSCLCGLVLIASFAQRFLGFYRDASIDQLNTRIEQGPAKGLLTTEDSANQYNELYEVIHEQFINSPNATVIHMKLVPWAYLCSEWRYYAPTSWANELNSSRLKQYYDIHDGILPDFVFIYSAEVGAYRGNYFNNHSDENYVNEMDYSGELYEKLTGKEYETIKMPLVTIYKNKELER